MGATGRPRKLGLPRRRSAKPPSPRPTPPPLRAPALGLTLLAALLAVGTTGPAVPASLRAVVDERGDAILEVGLALVRLVGRELAVLHRLVDVLLGVLDHRVDHLLLVDVPVLGDLGDG